MYESRDKSTYEVILDRPPSNEKFNILTELISKACSEVKIDTVSSANLHPDQLWLKDSRKEIRAPIGVAGARDQLEFLLGENSQGNEVSQALLAGMPGAGKSFTLHSIINSLAMRYSPDELELYLLDYKEGVEFQIYVDPERGEDGNASEQLTTTRALPHAKVISIESDREFGLSVLRKIRAEFERRADKWKAISNSVTKIAEYRDQTGEKMPRILVVIDEFQVLFEDADPISAEINQIFDFIVREGRAFGIHLLLASQSLNIKNLSRGVFDFIDLRMAMRMNQNVASMILAEGNTDVVEMLDRSGRILYNDYFGRKGSNNIGQVADFNPQARIDALRKIQETVETQNYRRPVSDPLVLFDGRHPTRLQDNGLLSTIVEHSEWLSSAQIKKRINQSNWRTRQHPSIAWLGEAMRIGDHAHAIFRRQKASNLLMVGSDAECIYGMLGGILTSLVSCHKPDEAVFCIADLSDEEDDSIDWSSLSLDFRETFSEFALIDVAKDFSDRSRNIQKTPSLIKQVYTELKNRQQFRKDNPDSSDVGPTIFFVCAFGTLECLYSLNSVTDERGNPALSDDTKRLLEIAVRGPELGIHVILWVENLEVLKQMCAGKEKQILNAFSLRTCLAMSKIDSNLLLNDNAAAKLPALRAYIKDVNSAGHLEKFKPYAVPSKQVLAHYGEKLSRKNYEEN